MIYKKIFIAFVCFFCVIVTVKESNTRDFGNPLVNAAHNCDFRKIKALIKQGIDVNGKDNHGLTAISRAVGVRCGYGLVEMLLQAGANPKMKNQN